MRLGAACERPIFANPMVAPRRTEHVANDQLRQPSQLDNLFAVADCADVFGLKNRPAALSMIGACTFNRAAAGRSP